MSALVHDRAALQLDTLPDDLLVHLAQEGEAGAFDTLIRRHHDKAHALAMGMMRNDADARDCVQDAFLNAWRKLDSFRGDAKFSSWLFRITHNACLMRMRRRRRRPEVSLDVQLGEESLERPVEDPHALQDEVMEISELGVQLAAAIETLPDNYRAVFELADLEHRSMKDIADALDLTVPNVKTRLHRARLKLRTALTPYLDAQPA